MAETKPKRVFLFDMTRQRSHLFFRFLSTHPEVQPLWHPYLGAHLLGPERFTQFDFNGNKLPTDGLEWDVLLNNETYEVATAKLAAAVEDASKQGKIFMANEHCQMVCRQEVVLPLLRNDATLPSMSSNPTYIPDDIFDSLTPIFIIRHPVLAVASNYEMFTATSNIRPGDDGWIRPTCLRTQRFVFDYFFQRDGKAPLVVDGEDVVWRTDIGSKVCEALGIDGSKLREEWEPVPQEERIKDPLVSRFTQVSDDSTGIHRKKGVRPEISLEQAVKEWEGKYGKDVAVRLRATVEENMEHFEYMNRWKI